jgi:hypothetical protein
MIDGIKVLRAVEGWETPSSFEGVWGGGGSQISDLKNFFSPYPISKADGEYCPNM